MIIIDNIIQNLNEVIIDEPVLFNTDELFTHEYSQFPTKLITLHNFKDADDSVASLINEINSLKSRGLYDLASKKEYEYKDILLPYSFGAESVNMMEEEIRNTQIMTIQKSQCVFTDELEPEICDVGDIWLGV